MRGKSKFCSQPVAFPHEKSQLNIKEARDLQMFSLKVRTVTLARVENQGRNDELAMFTFFPPLDEFDSFKLRRRQCLIYS